MPSPVNGSKKSAASPTSAAPASQARRAKVANGPVARTGVVLSAPTNRSARCGRDAIHCSKNAVLSSPTRFARDCGITTATFILPSPTSTIPRSEEHTSELQSLRHLVCRLLLEKKKKKKTQIKYKQ